MAATTVRVHVLGHTKDGWLSLYGGKPIFKLVTDEDMAWSAQEAYEGVNKRTIAEYAHARYPMCDEIDLDYSREDEEGLHEADFTQILYLEEE